MLQLQPTTVIDDEDDLSSAPHAPSMPRLTEFIWDGLRDSCFHGTQADTVGRSSGKTTLGRKSSGIILRTPLREDKSIMKSPSIVFSDAMPLSHPMIDEDDDLPCKPRASIMSHSLSLAADVSGSCSKKIRTNSIGNTVGPKVKYPIEQRANGRTWVVAGKKEIERCFFKRNFDKITAHDCSCD